MIGNHAIAIVHLEGVLSKNPKEMNAYTEPYEEYSHLLHKFSLIQQCKTSAKIIRV